MSEQDADGWTIVEPEKSTTLETFPETTCSQKRTTYREGTTRNKQGETQIWMGGKWLPSES